MMKVSKNTALLEINAVTDNMIKTGESEEFINKLLDSINKLEDVYRQDIQGSENVDIAKQVIGRKGHYLRLTTEKTGVFLIWHNHTNKTYTIWSPTKEALECAIGVIKHRIYITTQRNNPDMYDDVCV